MENNELNELQVKMEKKIFIEKIKNGMGENMKNTLTPSIWKKLLYKIKLYLLN